MKKKKPTPNPKKKAAKKPRKKKPGINPYGDNHKKRGKEKPPTDDFKDLDMPEDFDLLGEQPEF